ncbi:hypothetical protein ACWGID_39175 [Kribbella sp. NPDC054772]
MDRNATPHLGEAGQHLWPDHTQAPNDPVWKVHPPTAPRPPRTASRLASIAGVLGVLTFALGTALMITNR